MVSWTELVKDPTFSRGFTSESTLSNKSFSALEMLGFGIFDLIKHSIYICVFSTAYIIWVYAFWIKNVNTAFCFHCSG